MDASADSTLHHVTHGSQEAARTTLSKLCYSKIFLHAAKYPFGPVAGFIVGKRVADNKFEITDALPVCHGSPAGPMFDLALLMGDAMHEQSQVIGLYFSGGHKDSDEAPRFVNRISKGILARADNCVIVQLKSAQIQDPSKLAIGMTNRGNALNFSMEDSTADVNDCVDAMLAKNCHHRLVDFEDHMGDKTADFRNVDIAQHLK